MTTIADAHESLVAGLRAMGPVSASAEAEVRKLPIRLQFVATGHEVTTEGDRPNQCCLIVDGFFVRSTMLAGGRRQILSFHLRGDVPDLHGLHLLRNDFSLDAVTPGRVGFIAHEALHAAMEAAPSLAALLWRMSLADAAIARTWIASIGRRAAYQRIAHLICETFVRMRALGLAEETGFTLPFTQNELADVLGLSPVHVNRTLQQLRRDGVIVSRGRQLGFTDWRRLQEAGDFDGDYLLQPDERVFASR